jgi:outer membrane lipoprotein-sorting protein
MMKILAHCIICSLVAVTPAAQAWADTPAPADQPAPKPVTPVTLTGKDADAAIHRANAFLSSAATMVGDFVQTGADGRHSEGKIYVQKPGKLRFEYAAPDTLEVISDGKSVAVNDRKLKTQQTYAIFQTPLKFLLEDKINLAGDTQILNVMASPEATMILLDDRTTFGGTSRIRLIFDPVTFELRQWQVRDPQGYETLVTLYNIDLKQKPDPALFKIVPPKELYDSPKATAIPIK